MSRQEEPVAWRGTEAAEKGAAAGSVEEGWKDRLVLGRESSWGLLSGGCGHLRQGRLLRLASGHLAGAEMSREHEGHSPATEMDTRRLSE